MKLKIPKTITIRFEDDDNVKKQLGPEQWNDVEQSRRYPWVKFVKFLLDTDPRFNDTGPHIRAAARIENAIADKGEDDEVDILKDDLAQLASVAESPQEYPCAVRADGKRSHIVRQFLSYIDVIQDAYKAAA